ncbi:hypothetical protein GN958_ATG14990 [Phytophthora infestans]|uniref:Uncharacterized protein n=1 Tax=Phytophthora infestans TaxID=4787 RepID=A0A8S9U4B9_PHYIN|nr:hypothetical protein GN958_ATG14990 [Phytophthora infestans]
MASRPLHPSNGNSSPARHTVVQRWINSVAPAPHSPKPTHFPVKRWPPPKVEDSPVIATPTPINKTTVTEPETTPPPPPPPVRHGLTLTASPLAPVVKQHSSSSDLSASSCSTADSEADRKLEESLTEKQKPVPVSPVRAMLKRTESEAGVPTPSKPIAVNALISLTKSYPPAQTQLPHDPSVILTTPKQAEQSPPDCYEIDPFHLLLPVEAVPTLPDEVISVYDSAAVDMEKNIKKVANKVLKKDKVRLEEFKVNSRLFGTDFMDAHAYLDTLIKDFGPIRALQLVPCLLSVQPSMVKCNALLLNAKNYLLRNKDELEHEVKSLRASSSRKIAVVVTGNELTAVTIDAVASKVSPAEAITQTHAVFFSNEVDNRVNLTGGDQNNFGSPAGDSTVSKNSSTTAPPSVPDAVFVSVPELVQNEPPRVLSEDVTTTNKDTKPEEPMPEPQVLQLSATLPPRINIAVSAQYQTPVTAPAVKKLAPSPVIENRAEADTVRDNEEEIRAENLFGKAIKPQENEQHSMHDNRYLDVPATPASPASSVRSFDEAESLFGERLSFSPRTNTSPGRQKSVTWGETKTMNLPAQKDTPVETKKKPAPLLFGLATAAAFDSDSESDFSD